MPWIVDASVVVVAWCLDDEATPATELLLDRQRSDAATAPLLLTVEVANVLVMAARRGRMSAAKRDELLDWVLQLPIRVAAVPASTMVVAAIALADKHRLTVYDATYLELALRLNLPLASLDKELVTAARAEGVTIL